MSNSTTPAKSGGINLSPKQITGIVIGILALIFVFSNTGQVTLSFLFLQITTPGWVMLLILLAAGFAAGFLVARGRYKN